MTLLHQQEKTVSDGLEQVKQKIKEYEDTLRNGSIETLLQCEGNIKGQKASLPKIFPMMPPIFVRSQIDSQSLAEMFGRLTNQAGEQKADNKNNPHHTSKSIEKGKSPPLQSATPRQGGGKRTFEKSSSIPQCNQIFS